MRQKIPRPCWCSSPTSLQSKNIILGLLVDMRQKNPPPLLVFAGALVGVLHQQASNQRTLSLGYSSICVRKIPRPCWCSSPTSLQSKNIILGLLVDMRQKIPRPSWCSSPTSLQSKNIILGLLVNMRQKIPIPRPCWCSSPTSLQSKNIILGLLPALVGVLHQQASKARNVIPVVACRCAQENPRPCWCSPRPCWCSSPTSLQSKNIILGLLVNMRQKIPILLIHYIKPGARVLIFLRILTQVLFHRIHMNIF
jgi:hypothetical protein